MLPSLGPQSSEGAHTKRQQLIKIMLCGTKRKRYCSQHPQPCNALYKHSRPFIPQYPCRPPCQDPHVHGSPWACSPRGAAACPRNVAGQGTFYHPAYSWRAAKTAKTKLESEKKNVSDSLAHPTCFLDADLCLKQAFLNSIQGLLLLSPCENLGWELLKLVAPSSHPGQD